MTDTEAHGAEALRVIDATAQELDGIVATLPGTITDITVALRSLRQLHDQAMVQVAELVDKNHGLEQQVIDAEVRLEEESRRLHDEYEGKIQSLQTQVDRITYLFGEAKAEEQWAVERLAEALQLPVLGLRDMTEKTVAMIEEAKQMVRENL